MFLLNVFRFTPFGPFMIPPMSGDVKLPKCQVSISISKTNTFITSSKVASVVFGWFVDKIILIILIVIIQIVWPLFSPLN